MLGTPFSPIGKRVIVWERIGEDHAEHETVIWALGHFTAISFLVCVAYSLMVPHGVGMQQFLEMVLPAFKWLTWWGLLLGLLESFLYGVYAGLVFCPIYNLLYRRLGGQAGRAT
jgi:hypothetical protein